MDDLVTWLRAQIAETERVAGDLPADGEYVEGHNVLRMRVGDFAWPDRWNPIQVLAQCEAHTALLDVHEPYLSEEIGNRQRCFCCGTPADPWPCITLRFLALAYQHNPGYREEWRP